MFATSLALSAALAVPSFPAPKPTPDEGKGPGYLGVTYTKPTAGGGTGPEEMVVTGVREGSPADKAGVRVGDVIQRIDGVKIDRAMLETVSTMVGGIKPGTRVPVQLRREEKVMTVMVVIKQRPDDFYPTPTPLPRP